MHVKKPSQVKPFDYYYSGDPAFDRESDKFDHARFRETGDADALPLLVGRTATRFTLRSLTSRERYYCQQKAGEGLGMLAWYGVAIACEDIDPVVVEDEPHKVERVKDGSVYRLSDIDMEILATVDEGKLIAELADRIFTEVSSPGKS